MVADKCNNDIYQYLLDCEKWVKLNKFPKSIDKICGVFEINDVFYVVSNKGILALNNFFKFPSNKHYAWCTSCQIGNNILLICMNLCEYVESKLFDPVNKQWSDVSIKTERKGFDAVEFLNQIWIVGGLGHDDDDENYEYLNSVQIYDPVNKFTYLSPVKMVQRRYHHKVIVYKDSLFVFGGCDDYDKPLNSVEMYSPKTNKFVTMAPMKVARSNFACCRVGNLVYCVGGWNSGGFTNYVEVYNLDTNQWCNGKNFPVVSASNLHACAVSNKL